MTRASRLAAADELRKLATKCGYCDLETGASSAFCPEHGNLGSYEADEILALLREGIQRYADLTGDRIQMNIRRASRLRAEKGSK